ncbi:MAG TPA: hypothetical protein VIU63_01730, partial [Nitrospira sp.]
QNKDARLCESAFVRALELLDLTIEDHDGKAGEKNSHVRANCCAMRCRVEQNTAAISLGSIDTSITLPWRHVPADEVNIVRRKFLIAC